MDLLIQWAPQLLQGDWFVRNGSLAISETGSDDLKNAVLVSLFTWGVAPVGYAGDPRGWWGDSYEPSPIGSKLWMLFRAKKSDGAAVLKQAQGYCLEALQWLLDDGIAATVDANCFWFKPDALGITISITKPSGQSFGFAWTWGGF